jgi:hypothetical protein
MLPHLFRLIAMLVSVTEQTVSVVTSPVKVDCHAGVCDRADCLCGGNHKND